MRLFRLQVFRTTNLTHHLIFLDIFLLLQLNINVFDKVSLQKETYTPWETIRAENTFKSELYSPKYNFKELRILFNKLEIIWLSAVTRWFVHPATRPPLESRPPDVSSPYQLVSGTSNRGYTEIWRRIVSTPSRPPGTRRRRDNMS